MNKQKILKLLLIVLPVMAVLLATTVDSVMVFDSNAGSVQYYSYFSLIPGLGVQMVLPLAAILCIVTTVLAVAAVALKKNGFVTAVKWTAFAAATAAVLPVVFRGETVVVPNVLLPVLMLGEFVAAFLLNKENARESSGKTGERIRKQHS